MSTMWSSIRDASMYEFKRWGYRCENSRKGYATVESGDEEQGKYVSPFQGRVFLRSG